MLFNWRTTPQCFHSIQRFCSLDAKETSRAAYLKGAHAELHTQAHVDVEVVGQEVKDHVVGPEERYQQQGRLSQAPWWKE